MKNLLIIGISIAALIFGCTKSYEEDQEYIPKNNNAYLIHEQFADYGVTIEQVDSAITATELKLLTQAPIIEPRWNNWYQDITPYTSDATLDNFPYLHTNVYQELPDSISENCTYKWYTYNGSDSTLISESYTIGTFGALTEMLCSGVQYIGCQLTYTYGTSYTVSDLLLFTGAYGTNNPTYDYDVNGIVNVSDLLVFIGYYGAEVQHVYYRKEPCLILYNSVVEDCTNGLTMFDLFQSSMSEFPTLLTENLYLQD